jgi:hypothetical protein
MMMQTCENANSKNKDYSARVFGQGTKKDVEVLVQTLGVSVSSFVVMSNVVSLFSDVRRLNIMYRYLHDDY